MGRWKDRGTGWTFRTDGHWLIGERFVLRPLALHDADSLLEVFGPEVVGWKGYSSNPSELIEMAERWCRYGHNSREGHPLYPLGDMWSGDRGSGRVPGGAGSTPKDQYGVESARPAAA